MNPYLKMLSALALVASSKLSFAQVTFEKVMLTEVSWGNVDGAEVANFSPFPVDLTGWTLHWREGVGTAIVSAPLDFTLQPGEIALILENTPIEPSEAPQGVRVSRALPSVATTAQSLNVWLEDATGASRDHVTISSASGASPVAYGTFRGFVRRGVLAGNVGDVGVERIWGLDSDAGDDWTEQPNRSFGLENRSSGLRGSDPRFTPAIVINEIDTSPDFLELRNVAGFPVHMQGFFLLYSARQNSPVRRIDPFPSPFSLAPGAYVVIGNGGSPPSELPVGVPFVNLQAIGSGTLQLSTSEFALGLYDDAGQCLDVVRTTEPGATQVHNHPRLPAPWDAFVGAAGRRTGGDSALGRTTSVDTDSGLDWNPVWTRTMGFGNSGFSSSSDSMGDLIDVRVNEGTGRGVTVIVNAGDAAAGMTQFFFVSIGHRFGRGPMLGLGPDALVNWSVLYGVAPFMSLLDAQGSARWDFPPGTVPAGVQSDNIFYVQGLPTTLRLTPVLEFDTN